MGILKRIFRKNNSVCGSKNTAKERLKLVLVQDRMNLDSAKLDGLKNDLIDVIDKHLDIDRKAMDVSFCREGDSVAIVANIPVMTETT